MATLDDDRLIGRAVEVRSVNGVAYRGVVVSVREAGELGELFELSSIASKADKRLVFVTDRRTQVRAFNTIFFNQLIATLREHGYPPAEIYGRAIARYLKNDCVVDIRLSDDNEVAVVCSYRNHVEAQYLGRSGEIDAIRAMIIFALDGPVRENEKTVAPSAAACIRACAVPVPSGMSTLQDIPLKKIDGTQATLKEWAGNVLLVVNVASKCGLTPQYEGLEKLYEKQKARGLQILGFPANNFGAQEPGTNAEIASFCSTSYGVTFPMFEKLSVGPDDRHPLYRELIAAQPEPGDIRWNFEKFLIARDGTVVERFAPQVAPDDPQLVAAIDRELAKPA